jgi:hypothetical protein
VQQGELLNVNSSKAFKGLRRFPKDSDRSKCQWKSHVVWSDLDIDRRPNSTSQPGCKDLCFLVSDFSNVDPSEFGIEGKRSKALRVAKYELKVLVGAADVRFELWYDGRRKSEESNANIDIKWSKGNAYDEIDVERSLLSRFIPLSLTRRGTGSMLE